MKNIVLPVLMGSERTEIRRKTMRVRKAIIPAAGFGTRVLPASKAMPKEMIPIVDKPTIQYLVEEAARAGIHDILIITSRGKTDVEDHFDRSPELEKRLTDSGRYAECDALRCISALARIHYIRQPEMLGLGHAVALGRAFAGGEPVAVLYGDDVVIGENPAIGQLAAAYEEFGLGVAGIKPVPKEMLPKYCSLAVTPIRDRLFRVSDMIEKPAPGEEISNYSILGRCILPPEIYDILDRIPRGAGDEFQLTDAMRALARGDGMIGVEYEGTRYDMGNKMGILQAGVETALIHPELGEEFRAYLKQLAATL
jgi:UTP--glucose-1-phosphate uridylyltransferase